MGDINTNWIVLTLLGSVLNLPMILTGCRKVWTWIKSRKFNGTWVLMMNGDHRTRFYICKIQEALDGKVKIRKYHGKDYDEEFDVGNNQYLEQVRFEGMKTAENINLQFATQKEIVGEAHLHILNRDCILDSSNLYWEGICTEFAANVQQKISLTKVKSLEEARMLISETKRTEYVAKLDPCIKLSVIITVYNHESELMECLQSVVNLIPPDKIPEVQIILIDNGSLEHIKTKFLKEHPNKEQEKIKIEYVKILHRDVNFSRNMGLLHATGEYVLFLDATDKLLQSFYQNFFENYASGEYPLILGGYRAVLTDNSFKDVQPQAEEYSREDLMLHLDSRKDLQLGSAEGKLYKNAIIRANHCMFDFGLYGDTRFNLQYQRYIVCAKIDGGIWYQYSKRNLAQYEAGTTVSEFISEKIKVYMKYKEAMGTMKGKTKKQKNAAAARNKMLEKYEESVLKEIQDRIVG